MNPLPEYKLVRSKRKSVGLIVGGDGTLTVRAPLRLGRAQIEAVVAGKQDWIRRKQAEVRARSPQPHRYVEGEQFWYLGAAYPLRVSAGTGVSLRFDGQQFTLSRPRGSPAEDGRAVEAARASFTRWYQAAARRLIGARAEELSRRYGLSYARLRITSARTRWGSCSSRRTLSFAWRLVMAPPEIVDYVVTHELAHLAHPNHSPAFWQAVAALLPDFAPRRAWLRKNGALFSL